MAAYDPIGIAASTMLACKVLQREIMQPQDQYPHNTAVDLAEKVLEVEQELDIHKLLPNELLQRQPRLFIAWIQNDYSKDPPKRFITSWINMISKISNPEQWQYIPTADNPADIGTIPITVKDLEASPWLTGPPFLLQSHPITPTSPPALEIPIIKNTLCSSYFRTQNHHATEEISSEAMWENRHTE